MLMFLQITTHKLKQISYLYLMCQIQLFLQQCPSNASQTSSLHARGIQNKLCLQRMVYLIIFQWGLNWLRKPHILVSQDTVWPKFLISKMTAVYYTELHLHQEGKGG